MAIKSKTTRRRVVKSAEDRRREIMDAAVKVFTSKGVSRATVADITRAAGVAKGTFYLYFDTKEHLVAALRERFVAELTEHAAPFVQAMGQVDWWELADAVCVDMVDWTLSHRDIIGAIMQSYSPDTHHILIEADVKMIRLLAAGLRAGADAGAFEIADAELTAAFLYNGVIYTVVQELMFAAEVDRDRLVEAARDLGRKVLAPGVPPKLTTDRQSV
jgi:AcrR family transcriptional regulator